MLLTIRIRVNCVLPKPYNRSCSIRACSVLRVSCFASALLGAAAWATLDAKTWRGHLQCCRAAMRASTLLTYWHGQETTVAPRFQRGLSVDS